MAVILGYEFFPTVCSLSELLGNEFAEVRREENNNRCFHLNFE